MPFTPFHMGAALAIKPAAGRHFSVLAFGLAQVAMDIEPLVGMLRDADRLHGWTHTLPGALAIGIAVAVASGRIVPPLLRFLHRKAAENRLGWLFSAQPPARHAVWTGALVGTLSHIVLDGLIHHDMQPLAPWLAGNPLVGHVDHDHVYLACAVAAAVGAAAWTLLRWKTRGRDSGRG